MIYFLIPLKSKYSSKNWAKVEAFLGQTLNSIYNQSSDQYKVAIAVHDVPEINLPESFKNKIEMIEVDYPEPEHVVHARRIDRSHKKRFLAHYVYKQGGGQMMFVDSDDFLSRQISQFVDENQSEHGWYVYDGYEYYMGSGAVKPCPKFNTFCGTCGILNLHKDDLPEEVGFEGYEPMSQKYIFDHGHNTWVEKFAEAGRPLKKLPFRAALYRLQSDESTSSMHRSDLGGGLKRKLYRALMPPVMNKKKLKEEFGLEL